MKSVAVITPTKCAPELFRCMDSVKNQTHKNVTHHVVIDGWRFAENRLILEMNNGMSAGLEHEFPHSRILQLQENTGAAGFYGHRIIAGMAHLVNEDYVFLLDSDNTYEPEHTESLVKILEDNPSARFAYSLRNIYDKENKFLCQDNCESLGKFPVWNSLASGIQPSYLVDTSAYAFRREFLIQVAHLWHRGYAGDRLFFQDMRNLFVNKVGFLCSGQYTMNYYLGSSETSPAPEFFTIGNEQQKNIYQADNKFPWEGKIT